MSQAETLLNSLLSGNTSDYSARSENEALVLVDTATDKQYKLYVFDGKLTMAETDESEYVDVGENDIPRGSIILIDPVTGDYYKLHVIDGRLMMSEITKAAGIEPRIVVDSDRYITVPDELRRIAVQYDHNIETVAFDCPRYWDGIDMSLMRIYINYQRPDKVIGDYLCDNVTVDESDPSIMHFDWTISRNVTMAHGRLKFLVCVKRVDDEGNESNHWNSELCEDLVISEGLESDGVIVETYPDVITQLLDRMESIEDAEVAVIGNQIIEVRDALTAYKSTNDKKIQDLVDIDDMFDKRVDGLETTLTGVETAIAHSLTAKGVTVPDKISIQDVPTLIDSIELDVPTALRGLVISKPPAKTEYYSGEAFDGDGMVVTADFGDGVKVAVDGYIVHPAIISETTTEIEVSLTVNGVTKTVTQPISVTSIVAKMLSAGSLISIAESKSSNAWYRLVDTDYCGNMLLVREECLDDSIAYYNTAPSQAYMTKYEGSNLDSHLNSAFYGSLPSETTSAIQAVDIPVRENALSVAAAIHLNRKVFALSAAEWGVGGASHEGEVVDYTDGIKSSADYWTREPVAGMTNLAYCIRTSGVKFNTSCTNKHAVRPAFCISKTQRMKEINGGWTVVS